MTAAFRVVAFLGPLGHGKSRVLNKVCGTKHASGAGASSCTRAIESGSNERHNLFVIGTPGFGSSECVAEHLGAQKLALEDTALSGVYAVVKYESRADNVGKNVELIMDFLGSDDVRVIVTHIDQANPEDGYDEAQFVTALTKYLGIPNNHITMVGKDTNGEEIVTFIASTLQAPRNYEVTPSQLATVSSLSGIRKYNKPINKVLAKLQAASDACHSVVKNGKTYESDVCIVVTQAKTRKMVEEEKTTIFRDAYENLASDSQKNLVYGKAGVHLSLKLQDFIKTTNKLLTWDVTDPRDPRNMYRKCKYCDAIYVKVSGCSHIARCGGSGQVPAAEEQKDTGGIEVEFHENNDEFSLRFVMEGVRYFAQGIVNLLMNRTQVKEAKAQEEGTMQAKIESARIMVHGI